MPFPLAPADDSHSGKQKQTQLHSLADRTSLLSHNPMLQPFDPHPAMPHAQSDNSHLRELGPGSYFLDLQQLSTLDIRSRSSHSNSAAAKAKSGSPQVAP